MGNAVASMASYKGGGGVKGPGTGTSDSVPVRLSKGEFVIPADSVKKIGAHTLHALVAATHKHVTPKGKAPVRRMANGGLVNDDPEDQKPTTYGQQMANVGSAIANGAGTIAKTVFGAPGYGLNALTGASVPASAPAPAPAQPSAVAALAAPSSAGAGRGIFSPPLASATGAARPDLANIPNLNGSTGTAVDGAPGVRKLIAPNGGVLYSNVAGADNDKLMSGQPGLQVAPAVATGTGVANPGAVATLAQQSASPIVLPDTGGYGLRDKATLAARNAGVDNGLLPEGGAVSFTSGGGQGARLASAERIALASNATSRANTQDTTAATLGASQIGAAAHLGSSQIGAGATMYGADTSARTAVQRLAQEAPEVQARTAELDAQAKLRQGTAVAQQALLAAKTPEERQTAEENLRATLGKDHVVRGIAVNLPAQDNGLPGGGAVWDDRTQTFRYPTQAGAAAPAPTKGLVKNGYRFRGGDPANQSNWEKV